MSSALSLLLQTQLLWQECGSGCKTISPFLQSVTNICALPFQAEVFRVAENQPGCCSLKTNRIMKLEFEVGEVPEGAAR